MEEKEELIKEAIFQNLNDVANARMYLQAVKAMREETISTESMFLALATQAMINDMFTLTMRVMDRTKGVASFWYLFKMKRDALEPLIATDLKFIKDTSDRLSRARNKSHAHIDKKYVYKSHLAWDEANISGINLERFLNIVYVALCGLFEATTGSKFVLPDYDSGDVRTVVSALTERTNISLAGLPEGRT
jgi:hypothetical protein